MSTELSIKGLITAQTAEAFLASLAAAKGDVVVRIDSDGGDMIQGFRMHHAIRARGNVDTVIDGRAASAATLPFLAGRKRSMPRGSYLVIHNPWTTASGDASAMRNNADMLEKARVDMVETYMAATGISREAIASLMDAETWIDAASAVQNRWATEIANGRAIQASLALGQFRNAPQAAIRAASPDAIMVGDYVALTYNGGETKGEVVEVLATGTASGNDGSVDATAQDPAALVEVYRETDTPGVYKESDVIVARLFSALTRVEEPTTAEEADPISAPMSGAITTKMKSKLLALLGVEANAREQFLASAIADLGVKPEAVSAALDAGQTGFLADHIKAAIDAVKAEADKLRPEASLLADVRATLGVPATADKAALLGAIEIKASARAAELAAKAGVSSAMLNAAAGKPGNDDGTREEIVAKFNAMKPGPVRSAFFSKHRSILIS